MAKPRTLYDKIWDDHLAHEAEDGTCLLYIDRHLVHEVTSPQAFEGLRMTGRKVRRYEDLPQRWREHLAAVAPKIAADPIAALDGPAARFDR